MHTPHSHIDSYLTSSLFLIQAEREHDHHDHILDPNGWPPSSSERLKKKLIKAKAIKGEMLGSI